MNLFAYFVTIFVLALATCHAVYGTVEFTEVKDSSGKLVFRLPLNNVIEIPNQQKEKSTPFLQLSIGGTKIEQVVKVNSTTWTLHLNDHSTVDLLNTAINNVSYYYLNWHGGGLNKDREICVHYQSSGNEHWFSTSNKLRIQWPMSTNMSVPRTAFNYLLDDNWDRSKFSAYRLQELLFLSTEGFAVLPDQYQPLFFRVEHNHGDPVMCFSVDATSPYMATNKDPSYLDIKLHLFAANDIRAVVDYVVHQSEFIPKPKEIPDEFLFKSPSWFYEGHRSGLVNYTQTLIANGFKTGEIVSSLQIEGNLSASADFDTIISEIHKLGFQVKLSHLPLVEHLYQETEPYFIKFDFGQTSYLVDFSNPNACKWYEVLLNKLHYDNGINSAYLLNYYTITSPSVYDKVSEKYPNTLITKYVETVSKVSKRGSHISEVAFKTQHLPVFLQFWHPMPEGVNGYLPHLIPAVLSLSVAGYSFLSANAVGSPIRPETEEMYIRWLQAITFLPHLSLKVLPMNYSANCVHITRKYLEFHADHAPIFIELAKQRVLYGNPIIRPMWYGEPENAKTYTIDDQFMVGDDIVVAPVLVSGMRQRSVYLPPGEWLDGHGKSYSGNANGEVLVDVPLEDLAYFTRKQNETILLD